MNLRREAIAGITTFFTMAYIVVVNPKILSTPGTGMAFSGVLTATVLVCFVMTLLMGAYAKLPFAVAPGMGINAFFTFTIILTHQVWWQVALGIIFWAGVLFLLISVTPIRETIAKAIPAELRIGTAAGIGIFLTFIGLKNAGLITSDPVTFVRLGELGGAALLAVLGLVVTVALMIRGSAFAFLAGIFLVTLVAWAAGQVPAPESLFSKPDFHTVFLKLDIFGALKLSLLPAITGILFTDLFDSISTFIGVAHAADLLDEQGQSAQFETGFDCRFVRHFRRRSRWNILGHGVYRKHCRHQQRWSHWLDISLHRALLPAVLLSRAACGDGAALRNLARAASRRSFDVSQRQPD